MARSITKLTMLLTLGALTAFPLAPACDCGGAPPGGGEGEGDGEGDDGEGDASEGEGEGDGGEGEGEPDPNRDDNDQRDSDCDGLSDAEEFGNVYPGGGTTAPGDPDSDDDGVPDGTELGRTSTVADACDDRFTPDADPDTVTDPTSADTDGDGLLDGQEDADHDGAVGRFQESDPNNPDSDGDGLCDGQNDVPPVCTGGDDTPIPAFPDADGDGLPDALDASPADADSDDDGLCDGPADVAGVCVAGEDIDADGFRDPDETDPGEADSDCDGVGDLDEITTTHTNPTNADGDGDGLLDGIEVGAPARGALGACPACPGDGDLGATTTEPDDADSDGDGIPDGAEDQDHDGQVDDGELDPADPTDGDEPAVQAACALANLVPLSSRVAAEADIQVAVPRRDAGAFADQLPLHDGANRVVGVAGHDRGARVAFVAVKRAPAGADPLADEAQVRALLDGVDNVRNALTRTFTTWDGFAAVHASYDTDGLVGAKARANAIAAALTGTADAFAVDDDPAATDGFTVEAEMVRRSDQTTIVLVAVTPKELAGGASGFLVKDLADGSALGQAADTTGASCDRFPSEGFASLDVLWAVDNSASMAAKQAAVASAGDAFQARVENAGVTVRTAAVTSGFYLPGAGAGCTNTVCAESTGNQCRQWTSDLLTMVKWFTSSPADPAWLGAGNNSNGFDCNQPIEAIIQGAKRILSDPAVGGAATFAPAQVVPDAGHFTENGNLLVIFVGDVDDQNPTASSSDAAVNAQTIADYAAFFRALPLRSVQMGGILCPDGQTCGENRFNNPRIDHGLVNEFGGIIGSITDLATIPDNVNAILDGALVNASPYVLTQTPITSTVKVAMDAGATLGACDTNDVPRSRENGFDVDPVTRTVAFFGTCRPDPARPGALIAISYRTWIDQTPSPDLEQPPCAACATCTGVERCDLDACACVCDVELTCREDFVWDAQLCGCVCDGAALTCDDLHEPDPDLCACTCKESCGGCPDGYVCNESLCECDVDTGIGG